LWWVQIDLYGGAISAIPASDSSYTHRDAILNCQFYSSGSPYPAGGIEFMSGLVSSLDSSPYAMYPNYVDPTLTADQWHALYFGDNYQRLTVIKRDLDPSNLFSFPQSIEVAATSVTTTATSSTASSASQGSKSNSEPIRSPYSGNVFAFAFLCTLFVLRM